MSNSRARTSRAERMAMLRETAGTPGRPRGRSSSYSAQIALSAQQAIKPTALSEKSINTASDEAPSDLFEGCFSPPSTPITTTAVGKENSSSSGPKPVFRSSSGHSLVDAVFQEPIKEEDEQDEHIYDNFLLNRAPSMRPVAAKKTTFKPAKVVEQIAEEEPAPEPAAPAAETMSTSESDEIIQAAVSNEKVTSGTKRSGSSARKRASRKRPASSTLPTVLSPSSLTDFSSFEFPVEMDTKEEAKEDPFQPRPASKKRPPSMDSSDDIMTALRKRARIAREKQPKQTTPPSGKSRVGQITTPAAQPVAARTRRNTLVVKERVLAPLSKDEIQAEVAKQRKYLDSAERIVDAMEGPHDDLLLDCRQQAHVAIASIQALLEASAEPSNGENARNVKFGGLTLPLDWLEYDEKAICHFFLIIKCGPHVVHTSVRQAEDTFMKIHFPETFTFQDVGADFDIEVTVYCCKVTPRRDSIFDHGTPKKAMEMAHRTAHKIYTVTPKKLFKKLAGKKSSDAMPPAPAPVIATPKAHRQKKIPDFHPIAKCVINHNNIVGDQFDLQHLDAATYPIGKSVYVNIDIQEAEHAVEHCDFLTLFAVDPKPTWTRQWAKLHANTLGFYEVALNKRKQDQQPVVREINLRDWKGFTAKKLSSTVCSRKFSFAIMDGEGGEVLRMAADGKEARQAWIEVFNHQIVNASSWRK